MAQNDGSLLFDTNIDTKNFSSGIDSMATVAAAGLAAITGAIAGASTYAMSVGASFEEGMSGVAAISGATGEELKKLENTAKELGAKTKFSASEAANAMTNLAAAGFNTSEIISAVPGLMNLAAASGEDLATSTDIAASTLRGFGLNASDTAHVADVLAENANRTNAAVSDTGEAMKYIAPVAKAMGISFEETSAAIGIMANSGIKGSQAGTTLRGALTRLVKPTGDMVSTMESLGVEFFDAQGNMKPLKGIIEELEKGTKGLTTQQKNQALTTLFGQEALSGMLALVDGGADQLEDQTQSYIDCDGSAQAMADTMNDNLAGQFTILGSSLEGLGIAAYEKFESPMKEAVDASINEINHLTNAMGPGGELEESMNTFANYAGDMIENLIGLATDIIPMAIDGFNFLAENLDIVTVAVTTLGGAYAVYTANMLAQQIVATHGASIAIASATAELIHGSAMGVLTGQISLATGAQEIYNAVQMACPWAWTALAVAGVVAAFGTLIVGTQRIAGEMLEVNNRVIDNAKSWEELQTAQNDQIATDLAEINHTADLKDELDGLIDKNGKVKKGYEDRAKYIANELSEATGVEIELVDGVIKGYDELSKSIDNAIAKQQLEAVIEGMKESYDEATKNKEQAYDDWQALEEQYEVETTKIKERYRHLREHGYTEEQIAQDQTIQNLEGNLKATKFMLDKAESTYKDYAYTVSYYEELKRAAVEGNTDKINKLLEEHQEYVLEQSRKAGEKYKDQIDKTIAEYNTLVEARKKGNRTVTDNMLEEAKKQYEIAYSSGVKMLQAYQKDSEEYFGVGSEKIAQIIKGLESEEPLLQNEAKVALQELMNNLKGNPSETAQIGYDICAGLATGLESGIPMIREKAYKVADEANTQFASYYEIASPSRLMKRQGGFITEGLAIGLENGLNSPLSAMSNMSDKLHHAFDDSFNTGYVVDAANNLMAGLGSRATSTSDMNYQGVSTDYEAIGKEVAKAIGDSGIRVEVGRREFGRLVNEVI